MWRRSLYSTALAAVALVLLAAPALAGGWAVTTFDPWPAEGFRAGESYRLGYTIRQHGVQPFGEARTEIRIRSGQGDVVQSFPGRPEGSVGHYVAEVRFPSSGDWIWEVTQDPFATQQLGTITVATAMVSGNPVASSSMLLPVAVPLLMMLSIALFAWRGTLFGRRHAV
jgi:hypothetical protein